MPRLRGVSALPGTGTVHTEAGLPGHQANSWSRGKRPGSAPIETGVHAFFVFVFVSAFMLSKRTKDTFRERTQDWTNQMWRPVSHLGFRKWKTIFSITHT